MVAWHGMDGLNTLKDQSTEITGRTISGNPMSRKKKCEFFNYLSIPWADPEIFARGSPGPTARKQL